MQHFNRPLSAAILLLLVQTSGFAMSLGASTGSVTFGRPLDLTVQVRLDSPLDEPANCFSAEAYQGDSRLDSNRLRIDVKPAVNPLDALVRIRSTSTVTEPWAKVILRSTCGTKMSRQYDFLTDFVSDLPSTNPVTPNNRLPTVASKSLDAQEASTALMPLTTASQTKSLARKSVVSKAPAQKSLPAPASVAPVAPIAVASKALRPDKQKNDSLKNSVKLASKSLAAPESKSRLKMETFDLMDEQQVMLKMSTALLSPVVSDTPENKQALAQATAVWRALNAKPEDIAADAQKLQTTADELQRVKDSALKATTSLQERLRIAEEKKYANPVIYGLTGLLILALAGLTWLWLRVRQGTPTNYAWLHEQSATELTDSEQIDPRNLEPQFVPTHFSKTLDEPIKANFDHAHGTTRNNVALPTELQNKTVFTETEEQVSQEALAASTVPVTLGTTMVFTTPTLKTETLIDNNPLWPAEATLSTQTNPPEALVITAPEEFMLPVTLVEPEPQATPFDSAVQVDLDPWSKKDANLPANSLNIDFDFSKVMSTPAEIAPSNNNNMVEFYNDVDHEKIAPRPEDAQTRSLQSMATQLPKPLKKLKKPLQASAAATDQKSNLIDFDSFAKPPTLQ